MQGVHSLLLLINKVNTGSYFYIWLIWQIWIIPK